MQFLFFPFKTKKNRNNMRTYLNSNHLPPAVAAKPFTTYSQIFCTRDLPISLAGLYCGYLVCSYIYRWARNLLVYWCTLFKKGNSLPKLVFACAKMIFATNLVSFARWPAQTRALRMLREGWVTQAGKIINSDKNIFNSE
jgi:hypothetical protein